MYSPAENCEEGECPLENGDAVLGARFTVAAASEQIDEQQEQGENEHGRRQRSQDTQRLSQTHICN